MLALFAFVFMLKAAPGIVAGDAGFFFSCPFFIKAFCAGPCYSRSSFTIPIVASISSTHRIRHDSTVDRRLLGFFFTNLSIDFRLPVIMALAAPTSFSTSAR